MTNAYQELLEATIAHLEGCRARGITHVSLSPQAWDPLKTPAPVAAPINRSAPTPTPLPAMPQRPVPVSRSARPTPPAAAPSPPPEAAPPSASPPLASPEREAAIDRLRQQVSACLRCPSLAASRKQTVFGVGDIHSPLMFVGEAPGADEDDQGEPFVGKAGQLLTRIIQTMGFSRDTVYIANILKCRPDTPGQTAGNRKPTPDEMRTCLPYLLAQIDLIRPQVIVALGATAVAGLLGLTTGITKLRGHWQTLRGTPVMPTYHPAYLLRNQALATKREVWEDMLLVLERLGRPVSEKQRGFFLKPGS